jgi:serine/threonine-protein kinase RsbW
MSDTIRLSVPCKPEYVSTVRLTVSSVASRMGFDIEAVEDIKVAVSEACTNIINHSKLSGEDEYRIMCLSDAEKMQITVEDDGKGFNVDEYSEPKEGELQQGGLGLFIVKALMDEVDVVSEPGAGARFSMVKYLNAD